MAKMIPDTIERNDPRRNGEYMVYDWMSDPSIPGVCFYSLHQKNHVHKLIGEVDFLYVCKLGMLCIEVKGGQDIYREERQWYSVNQLGKRFQIHDPFVQSRDCMYALKDFIEKTYGKFSEESKLQRGYCVVFPECICRCKGNDIITEVMFDNRYNLADFKSFIEGTLKYWANIEVEKHNGLGSKQLTQKQVNQMVDLLQADFGSIPSMKLQIQHVEEKMQALSDEQMDVVEDMRENKRVLVQGPAGTGKSLIAIAKAKQSLAEHKRVLYLCFNRNMAQYARLNLPEDNMLQVKTFHALLGEYISEESYYYSKEALCEKYKEIKPSPVKYDVMVIDEGQDLMLDYIWDILDGFLKSGFEGGEWIVLTDPNQSIFVDSDQYTAGLDYLKELYMPTIVSLKKNWRNTAPIGRRTSRLTAVPPARHMKIDGPKVVCRRHISSESDMVRQLRGDIHSLLMGGTSVENIVILSPHVLAKSVLSSVKEMCNLKLVEPRDLNDRKKNQINYYTVQSYKGLESSVVFYIDIDGFTSYINRQMNYVAMSRAKALLYLYVKEEIDDEYDKMLDESI